VNQSILKLDKHEIFDLTEALYTFAILNHSGMWSELYSLQCQISDYLSVGCGYSESDVEENNMYYPEITEENAPYIWNRIKYYLDNRWDEC
jgi:hypothetical protein